MRTRRLAGLLPLVTLSIACGGADGVAPSSGDGATGAVASRDTVAPPARLDHLSFCWKQTPLATQRALVEATLRHTLEERSEIFVAVSGFAPCVDDLDSDIQLAATTNAEPEGWLGMKIDIGGRDFNTIDAARVERSATHTIASYFGVDFGLTSDQLAALPQLDLTADEIHAMQALSAPKALVAPSAQLVSRSAPTAPPRVLAVGQTLDVCPDDTIQLAGGLGLRVCSGDSESCVVTGATYQPQWHQRVQVVATAIAYSGVAFEGAGVALGLGRHVLPRSKAVGSISIPSSLRATVCDSTNASAHAIALGIDGCRKLTGTHGGAASLAGGFSPASPPRLVVVEHATASDVEVFRPALVVPDSDAPGGPRVRYVATLDAGTCADGAPRAAAGAWTAYRQFRDAPSPWGDARCVYEWTSPTSAPPDLDVLRHAVRAAELSPLIELPGDALTCTNGACDPPDGALTDGPFPPGGNDKPGCDVCSGKAFKNVAYITVDPSDPTSAFVVYVPGQATPLTLKNTGASSYVVKAPYIGTGDLRVYNQ